MNVYIQSVFLGIVEGLTEFFPVSSTAHLRIAEALMKINLDDEYWKMYTIVIQAGAILALCCFTSGASSSSGASFPHGESGTATSSSTRFAYPSRLYLHIGSGSAFEEVERPKSQQPHRDRHGAACGRNRHVGGGRVDLALRAEHHSTWRR